MAGLLRWRHDWLFKVLKLNVFICPILNLPRQFSQVALYFGGLITCMDIAICDLKYESRLPGDVQTLFQSECSAFDT